MGEHGFAEQVGISYAWLRRILHGEAPSDIVAERIKEALRTCHCCGHRVRIKQEGKLFDLAPLEDDAHVQ